MCLDAGRPVGYTFPWALNVGAKGRVDLDPFPGALPARELDRFFVHLLARLSPHNRDYEASREEVTVRRSVSPSLAYPYTWETSETCLQTRRGSLL